jgi:nucleoside phosphorylase
MIGIVFTTTEEAGPFVDRYGDGRFSDLDEDAPLHDDEVLVSVSGTGKIRSTLHAERLCRNYDLASLVHVGTCTALNEELEPRMLVGVSFVLEGDRIELAAPSYPRMPLDVPFDTDAEGTLVTQDHVVEDADERSYWQRIADVNDTTGYALAYVSAQHGVPCHIAKVVTGHAGEDNDSFREDRDYALTAIADVLTDYVE